ncbi:hypothetical protein [Sorangium sp. So ce1389]|uniref:hypothetical protein n=1 Tax=Sorangium sp. So ce1389 TaxID=3133336 RepID=UPI003F622F7C
MTRLAARAALTLALSVAAVSCQFISGVHELHVDDSGCGPAGTACGGTCASGKETPLGTCGDDGTCSAAPRSCAPYTCDASGTECATSCSTSRDCSDAVCDTSSGTCQACEWTPDESLPAVVKECAPQGGGTCSEFGIDMANQSVTLDASEHPVVLTCKGDQCNGALVTCMGPFPCEIICNDNSCEDLDLRCSDTGRCSLKCNDSGCSGNVKVTCKANSCSVDCSGRDGPTHPSIHRECGSSCSCSETECGGGGGGGGGVVGGGDGGQTPWQGDARDRG